jgi:hypothetical protein
MEKPKFTILDAYFEKRLRDNRHLCLVAGCIVLIVYALTFLF